MNLFAYALACALLPLGQGFKAAGSPTKRNYKIHLVAHRSMSQNLSDPDQAGFFADLGKLGTHASKIANIDKMHLFKALPDEIFTNPKWAKHVKEREGRGWWFWKAAIPNLLINNGTIFDGDVIIWLDADQWGMLDELAGRAGKAHDQDLDFIAKNGGTCQNQWTKGDTFKRFGVKWNDMHYGWAVQPWAAGWVMRVNSRSRQFLHNWENLMSDTRMASDDQAYPTENSPFFIAHRQDQSLLGMLLMANTKKQAKCNLLAGDKKQKYKLYTVPSITEMIAHESTWQRHKEFGVEGMKIFMPGLNDEGWF